MARRERESSWLWPLLAILPLCLGQACSRPTSEPAARPYETPFTVEKVARQYEPYGYVAHALGSVDGKAYTNSIEAFDISYEKGFRLFEVDLVLLGDGSVLAAHDKVEERYGVSKHFSETLPEEVGKLWGKYTPLSGRELLALVEDHPDIYMILDTKGAGREPHVQIAKRLVEVGLREYPLALERLIPHLIDQEHLDTLRALYPFNDYMLALYRAKRLGDDEVPEFLRRNGIRAVMMWWDKRYSPEFVESVRAVGSVPFVHSLTRRQKGELLRFRGQQVGAYTNGLYLDPRTLDPRWAGEVLPDGNYRAASPPPKSAEEVARARAKKRERRLAAAAADRERLAKQKASQREGKQRPPQKDGNGS